MIARSLRNDPGSIFLHIGTSTALLGFCVTDPLFLRSCSVFASTCSMAYNLTRSPPLINHCVWGGMFISVNLYHIYFLQKERQDVMLTYEE